MARRFRLRPGSAAWLLAHECRLFFYEMGDDKAGKQAKRGMPVLGMGLIAFVMAVIHFGVWSLMKHLPPLHGEPPAMIILGTGVALAVLFSLMLSLALNRSVKALFERGDLDLLLSSPLSARTIFQVRLGGIVFGVALLFLLFLTPFAHVGLWLGQPRWLGIYPALAGMASIAAALAMLATLALVRWIGVRRTRTVAQVLGALSGAAIFLISQIFGSLGQEARERAYTDLLPWVKKEAMLGSDSLIWLPVRALFGSWPDMLAFSLLALAAYWLTAHFTHDFFVRGVQQAGGAAAARTRTRQPGRQLPRRFRAGVWRNTLLKEWRLIARDPQLISQVLLQLLYLLPLFFVIFKGKAVLPGVAAGMTFLAASLAGSLVWIIVSAEDAPDLLRAAPVAPLQLRSAKLSAAVLPVCALLAPALFWLSLRQPWLGIAVMLSCAGAMSSAALIHLWHARPGTRSQFNKRGQNQLPAHLMELVSALSWAATVYLGLQSGWWGLAALAVVLLTLILAWALRTD